MINKEKSIEVIRENITITEAEIMVREKCVRVDKAKEILERIRKEKAKR